MKRKQRFLNRILLPALTVLLLLPPLSCLIFSHAARQYAYVQANRDLDTLQENILPLMKNSFTSWRDPGHSGQSAVSEVQTFLYQLGSLLRQTGGDAHVMILSGEMQIVYPRDEQEKAEVMSLADDFVKYIQTTEVVENGETTELNASDGQGYLVSIYRIPTKSIQLKYMIAYCPASKIGVWVRSASILVLGISSVLVLLAIIVLWFTARSVTKPLNRLCRAADQIGSGSFEKIKSEFSLQELEELRIAMNRMSEQLQQSDEIQKTFFQNVSHELRNPLMSISGYAQGIVQGIFQTPKDAAGTIMEESARLTELVNRLLTLSRMENDPQKPDLGFVRIIDPIEDCLDRVNGLALKNGVALTLTPFDPGLLAWCEEDLFCNIIENLLTNAIRYAKKSVSVSVSASADQVQIKVADDGDGIEEKDLPHIFERCYKGKGGNFGIGLAIACSAAQKMNGSLAADNQKNSGAVFTLSLKASE